MLVGDLPAGLVDDEFSTGNTVLNTIRDLHGAPPRDCHTVVALVDMRNFADCERLTVFADALGACVEFGHPAAGTALERVGRRLSPRARSCRPPRDCRPARPRAPRHAPVRVLLDWPAGLPDGGRHGFTPEHRAPEAAPAGDDGPAHAGAGGPPARRLAAPRPRPRLRGAHVRAARLAAELERTAGAEVRYPPPPLPPVLAVDDPGYADRPRPVFLRTTSPLTAPASGTLYNVAGGGFDAVVAVVDSVADTPELHAPDGLLSPSCGAHTAGRWLSSLVHPLGHREAPERSSMLPESLRGPAFSSYAPEEVGWPLQDLSDVELEALTEEREEAIRRAAAPTTPSRSSSLVPAERALPGAVPGRPDGLAARIACARSGTVNTRPSPLSGPGGPSWSRPGMAPPSARP